MGNVTLLYPEGIQNFPRTYIVGFVLPLTIINTTLAGGVLSFDTNTLQHHWDLPLTAEFAPASSNFYSLDYVFDLATCFHYFLGTPSPSTLNIGLRRLINEGEMRIQVALEFTPDPAQIADLPQISPYWRPYSFYN